MIDHRAALVPLLATLVAVAALASASACGSSAHEDAVANDAGDEPEADAPPAPPPPYPPGPYGTEPGDVIEDFTVLGYPFTRDARDRTQLPFREVHLSEAVAAGCTCLAIVLNAAGSQCGYCVGAHLGWANAVLADRSICAIEVIWQDYDGVTTGVGSSPPTHADIDALTSTGHPFPVGLATSSALRATSPASFYSVPQQLVVRVSDMRIIDAINGYSVDTVDAVKASCTSPTPPVERVAEGLTPRRLRLGKDAAFVSDWNDGIVRVDLPQGAPKTIATPSGVPDGIAVDDSYVYWATHEGAGPYEIGRVPQAGGPAEQLATSTSGFTSIAVDDTSVWFTRADGLVASLPKAGGPIVPLLAGETTPDSIVVDASSAWWIAGGKEIAAAPKTGGARVLVGRAPVLDAGPPITLVQLVDLGPRLVVRLTVPETQHLNGDSAWSFVGKAATAGDGVGPLGQGGPAFAEVGAPYGQTRIPIADRDYTSGRGIVGIMNNTNQSTFLTFGQPNVGSVTTDKDYVYWTVNADGLVPRGGGIRRRH